MQVEHRHKHAEAALHQLTHIVRKARVTHTVNQIKYTQRHAHTANHSNCSYLTGHLGTFILGFSESGLAARVSTLLEVGRDKTPAERPPCEPHHKHVHGRNPQLMNLIFYGKESMKWTL